MIPASDSYQLLSDGKLLAQWSCGNALAGNTLLERYILPLKNFFRARLTHSVDDLVQETLLAMVVNRSRLANQEAFRAYLFGTARLQLLVHLRRRRRDQALVARTGDEPELAVDEDATSVSAAPRGLLQAVGRLKPEFHEVLRLAYWEELTAPQIASSLGVPLGTVYSRLHRAKNQLQQAVSVKTVVA
jgi:RNA polymerase sigma-70 factor (ECF subfamily)